MLRIRAYGRRAIRSWLLATDATDAAELAVLHEVPTRVDCAALLDGEDGVACAVLDMWLCAGAGFFIGTRGSMYTDYIERFRVATGKVVDHLFFELGSGASAAAVVSPASAAAAVPRRCYCSAAGSQKEQDSSYCA